MNSGIYKWTSPSGKYYIGQSIDLRRRKKEFRINPINYTYTSKDSAIDRARKKYNDFNEWSYEILAFSDNIDELNRLEAEYIKKYDSTNSKKGYNSTSGGDGTKGHILTEDIRKNISKKMKGKYVGKLNPNYGHHLSEESKDRIRKAHIGLKNKYETLVKKSRPINQYKLDGTFVKKWIGASEAMHELGIDKSSIGRVCKGIQSSAGGYKWSYSDEA